VGAAGRGASVGFVKGTLHEDPSGDAAPPLSLRARALLLVSSIVGSGLVSLALGKDASWDLLNYHYYNPYAFLQSRMGWDLAPAQLQTYLNPLPDLLFFFLVEHLPEPSWVGFVMGSVHGIAVYLLIEIAWLVLGAQGRSKTWVLPVTAVGVGITGAAALPLIGGTSNDWIVAIFVLLGLLVALRTCVRGEDGSQRLRGLLVAGSAVGIAAGVKPAAVPYALALVIAVFAARPGRRGLLAAAVVGVSAAGGMALSGGYTMWQLQSAFGNPLFPFYNDIFRSEFWEPRRFRLDFFKPRNLLQWCFYPFYWARTNQGLVTEMPMRDARFAALLSLYLLGAVRWIGGLRTPRQASDLARPAATMQRLLLAFFAVAYLAWLYLFSILRYLAALELLTGILLAVLLLPAAGRPSARRVVVVIAVSLALVATTVHPNWGRSRFGARYFEVEPPELPDGSLVLLVGWAPMSFLIPLVRKDARFVGLENNILRPGQRHGLYRLAQETVRSHEGPLFSVNATQERDRVVAALAEHGLEREEASCLLVSSPQGTPLEFCPLRRSPGRQVDPPGSG